MSIMIWTAVALIGGADSLLRFYLDGAVVLGLLTGLALGHDQALPAGTAAIGYLARMHL